MVTKVKVCHVWVLGLLLLAVITAVSGKALSCGDAVSALIPCGSFLMGSGPPKPSSQCCTSAQGLNKMAVSIATRRAVCECFVKTGPSFGVRPERARLLPPLCKLKLNIPISPKTNCTKMA